MQTKYFIPLKNRTDLAEAVIITYSYLPLIGMISSMDAKGMTTYYSYDTFQRLRDIKDDNGFMLEHYQYNFQH